LRHENLEFPCLAANYRGVHTLPEKTIVTTALAPRHRAYDNSRLIDSSGAEFSVRSASKLRGFGPLWGWNVFLNQRICVLLDVEPTGRTYTADELRQIVLNDFRSWEGWQSRGDFRQLKASVLKASSPAEILRSLVGGGGE
jgi:hypothetical protein